MFGTKHHAESLILIYPTRVTNFGTSVDGYHILLCLFFPISPCMEHVKYREIQIEINFSVFGRIFVLSVMGVQSSTFYPDSTSKVSRKYTEFAEVYSRTKVPRINEDISLRQYILATYSKDIAILAKEYNLKPCSDSLLNIFRSLSTIREQLIRETRG